MNELVDIAWRASLGAGEILRARFVRSGKPSGAVAGKADGSPVSAADLASSEWLMSFLSRNSNFPVTCEESVVAYAERARWDRYWLVDPLDGTKEFLAGLDEFAVNVAFMSDGAPSVGVIYSPVTGVGYVAARGEGVRRRNGAGDAMVRGVPVPERRILVSRFHRTGPIDELMSMNGCTQADVLGSSLKFCRIAEGAAFLYPAFGGCSDWDSAAGHIIVTEAGGTIISLDTRRPPEYNSPSLRQKPFLVAARGVDIDKVRLPQGVA